MPLPIPFYLRTSQTTALTHTQLDGNLSILNTKIDNTTCNNVGNGVGIFESKETGANDGTINLYSLSGTNGITVGVSGNTLVIGGGGTDSDWVTSGDNIYNGNIGNVGIGGTNPKTKLELYSTGNTTAINNILRFSDNDAVITSFQEQFIGKIEFHSNENSGNGGVKSYIGGIQDSAAGSSIIFATTGGTDGTLEGTNPQDMIGERMRIDPVGNVGIGIGVTSGVPVVSAKLHVNNTTMEPSFLVEDSTHPDTTPFIISSGGSVSIGTTDVYFVGSSKTKLQTSRGSSGIPLSGLPISTTALFESDTTNSVALFSPDNNISQIYFGTPSDVFGANLRWDYTTKELKLGTSNASGKTIFQIANGVEAARIDENGNVGIGTSAPTKRLHISGNTLSEGDIYLPDDYKLRIGDSDDLQIYHDGASSRIGEVGTGNLLISGTELWLSDSATGKPFLIGNSALSNVKLYWSGETRTTTGEDGLILNKTVSGTPVANLSVRADGTIITGGTVPIGTHTTVDSQIDPNTTGVNIVYYTSSSGGGTITIGDSNTLPVGFKTKLIRTSTTNSATVGSSGTSTINGSTTKSLPTAVYSVTTCIANGNAWYCSTGTIL